MYHAQYAATPGLGGTPLGGGVSTPGSGTAATAQGMTPTATSGLSSLQGSMQGATVTAAPVSTPAPGTGGGMTIGGAATPANTPATTGAPGTTATITPSGIAVGVGGGIAGLQNAGHATSNLYIRSIPPEVDEATLQAIFAPYGLIESCRLFKNQWAPGGRNYAFVKYGTTSEAEAAIINLNGATVGASALEVKFADMDPHSTSPTDNLYVKNLPVSYTEADLAALFAAYGSVTECRVLASADPTKMSSGLVRLASVEQAAQLISLLNNTIPPGGSIPMFVKYADTAEERARKSQKYVRATARYAPYPGATPGGAGGTPTGAAGGMYAGANPGAAGMAGSTPGGGVAMPGGHHGGHRVMGAPGGGAAGPATPYMAPPNAAYGVVPGAGMPNGAGYDQSGGMAAYMGGMPPGMAHANGMPGPYGGAPGMVPGADPYADPMAGTGQPYSIYIKHLPPEADKLYLYEKFAPMGAILSVRILEDEAGKCRGVGFVNYVDQASAMRAIGVMNGAVLADKPLFVTLQTQRTKY